jgi:outer membrane protein OmpA-like peptidoglycan-associated protein
VKLSVRPRPSPIAIAAGFALAAIGAAQGQAADASGRLLPFVVPSGRVVINERSDFSRYDDGRYRGLVSRQSYLRLEVSTSATGAALYRGEVFALEELQRASQSQAGLVRDSLAVEFSVDARGRSSFTQDPGYPLLRGIPSPPPEPVGIGGRWQAEGAVAVRPLPDAPASRVRVLVEYEFQGEGSWAGRPALLVGARYALRYRGDDPLGDPALLSAQGGRQADIYLDADSGETLFIRERVDESYAYRGGPNVALRGFILHFYQGSLPGERAAIYTALGGGPSGTPSGAAAGPGALDASGSTGGTGGAAASGSGAAPSQGTGSAGTAPPSGASSAAAAVIAPPAADTGGGAAGDSPAFELSQGERGVVLLLYDLRFAPDSAELLPGEQGRLDAIADALKRIPGRSFLVEGHAAELGRPQGQQELSEARAKRIADELAARGIPASRLLYRGLGATRPIAANDNEAGRARNRRVEITVLD